MNLRIKDGSKIGNSRGAQTVEEVMLKCQILRNTSQTHGVNVEHLTLMGPKYNILNISGSKYKYCLCKLIFILGPAGTADEFRRIGRLPVYTYIIPTIRFTSDPTS